MKALLAFTWCGNNIDGVGVFLGISPNKLLNNRVASGNVTSLKWHAYIYIDIYIYIPLVSNITIIIWAVEMNTFNCICQYFFHKCVNIVLCIWQCKSVLLYIPLCFLGIRFQLTGHKLLRCIYSMQCILQMIAIEKCVIAQRHRHKPNWASVQ